MPLSPGTKGTTQGISIVIPVAGRVKLVDALLCSVRRAQEDFSGPSEILLLDNSTPQQQPAMKALAQSYQASYFVGSDNLSIKRNEGIQRARYNIVLFLDSDVVVSPTLLSRHFLAYKHGEVAGCLGYLQFVGPDNFIWKAVERTHVIDCFAIPLFQKTTNWGPTANISFRKDVLLKVGGFHSAFVKPGGEDVDLGFRIEDSGAIILCDQDAVVYHTKETWSSFRQVFKRFFYYGKADALLISRHKERTVWDIPTPSAFMMALSLSSISMAIVSGQCWSLLLPFLWVPIMLTAQAYFSLKLQKQAISLQNMTIEIIATLLFAQLDLSRMWGGLVYRVPNAFFRRIIFFDDQQVVDWSAAATSAFASIISLFITLLLSTVLFVPR